MSTILVQHLGYSYYIDTDATDGVPAAHEHAAADITSGTVDPARVTAAAAGQTLRLGAGGAVEGYYTGADMGHTFVSAPVSLSASPATVATLVLPAAGMYHVFGNMIVKSGTLTANRVVTFAFESAEVTSLEGGWAQAASIATSNGFGYATDLASMLPAVVFAGTQDDVYASVDFACHVTVSSATSLVMSATVPGDQAAVQAGSRMCVHRMG